MAQLNDKVSYIGIRCAPRVEEEIKRRAERHGWTVTQYVLRALDSAFAADADRASR